MEKPVGKIPVHTAPYAFTPARNAQQSGLAAKGRFAKSAKLGVADMPMRFRYLSDRQLQAGCNETLDWRQDFLAVNNRADGYPQPVFLP